MNPGLVVPLIGRDSSPVPNERQRWMLPSDQYSYIFAISSDHRYHPDIDQMINQASKAFGSLHSSIFCNEKQLSPIIWRRLFMAIVVDLLLWGCETWLLLSEDRNRLNVFFNKWVRAMVGTRWNGIREKRLTKKQLRERLDNIESFHEIYNRHCLNWFIKLANMPATQQNQITASLGKFLVLGAATAVVFAAASWKILARDSLMCWIISNLMTRTQFLVAVMGN